MTIWKPELEDNLPRYQALAEAIAQDLATGRLRPGDRLPTHRDLADVLGVTVGTISRGYAEAERRGLTYGEVGRGTFVGDSASLDPWPRQPDEPEVVDLSFSLPASIPEERNALAQTLRDIAADPSCTELLAYLPNSATKRQKAIAANWLSVTGIKVSPEDLLVTAGSQHGLNVVLSSVFLPGQVLLTGELTYPSIKSQARAFGVRLRGVALDEEGICPESLEQACTMEPRPSGVYLVPTIQNPTAGTLSEKRRQAIAAIARKHDLWIIEDDVHSFLLPKAPPALALFAPDRTLYLASVAKCLAPGLRTGFLIAPEVLRERLLTGIHTTMWMPPPLPVEVTTRWLADGTADRLIALKRAETEKRQRLAKRILSGQKYRHNPSGFQIWLPLPEPWHTDEFVARARERGVILVGSGSFAVSRGQVPHAVRLSIGIPTLTGLESALTTVAEMLHGHCRPNL